MSNSQNKKNEQQNNLCTTLTEQWKKGELEQGWYYIECIDLPERWIDIDYYLDDCYEDKGFCKGFFDHNDWRGIDKVLAPVPSYEEWQELSKQRNQLIRDVKDLAYIQEENQQLKELLKECHTQLLNKPIREIQYDIKMAELKDLLKRIYEAIK